MSQESQSKEQRVENLLDAIRELLQVASKQEIRDLDRRIEGIEKQVSGKQRKQETKKKETGKRQTKTEKLSNVISKHNDEVDIKTLLNETGFEEKTLRNTIHRLIKMGKIKRVKRGVYHTA